MGSRRLEAETTAEAYLELPKDRGIDVFLGNAGTDFASPVEAFARSDADGRPAPRPLLIPHESLAVSMAHGYHAAGSRPAAAMGHVSSGTVNASSERYPDPARIDEAARVLALAERPLILVSAAGIDPRAVAGLVELAEAGAIGVVEADPIYLNFPHGHPLHLGYNQSGSTNPSLAEADAILVVEADVPWYPALQKPDAGAKIIHLGVDPFFSRYPMRSYPCDVPIAATPAAALPLLAEAVRRHADRHAGGHRAERLAGEHRARHAAWETAALQQADKATIGFAWAARCLGELVDEDTVVVN